jgi:ribosomal-protein-alanine N-acetyltransferase
MIIRPMTAADVSGVLVVEHESFTIPWSEQAFMHEMQNNPFAYYYVLESDEGIAGYAGMWLVIDEVHVTNIAILPPYRGKGWGERLMQTLVDHARASGAIKMTLEVRASNFVAQKMYAKFGFIYQSTRLGYYSDNQEDAWVLAREWETS